MPTVRVTNEAIGQRSKGIAVLASLRRGQTGPRKRTVRTEERVSEFSEAARKTWEDLRIQHAPNKLILSKRSSDVFRVRAYVPSIRRSVDIGHIHNADGHFKEANTPARYGRRTEETVTKLSEKAKRAWYDLVALHAPSSLILLERPNGVFRVRVYDPTVRHGIGLGNIRNDDGLFEAVNSQKHRRKETAKVPEDLTREEAEILESLREEHQKPGLTLYVDKGRRVRIYDHQTRHDQYIGRLVGRFIAKGAPRDKRPRPPKQLSFGTNVKPRTRGPRVPTDFTAEALTKFNGLLKVYGNLNSPRPLPTGMQGEKKWRITRHNLITNKNEHLGVLYGDGTFSRDLLHDERLSGLTDRQKDKIIELEGQYGRLSIYGISNGICLLVKTYRMQGRFTIGTLDPDGNFSLSEDLPEALRSDQPTLELKLPGLRRESA